VMSRLLLVNAVVDCIFLGNLSHSFGNNVFLNRQFMYSEKESIVSMFICNS
jgi:hypothetical protein